ncbi:MAG: FAD synthetase family protein [Lachnospiraceae bacterium]|nr:FAD synthetase family protein [Lachnospiraceae bacterium]
MEVIRDTTEFQILRPTAVCIGKFDGVHMGHRKLIEKVVDKRCLGLIPTVFTFNPSPEELFSGVQNNELCTRHQKQEMLEKLGIELIIEFPLTLKTAAIDPLDFIEDILVGRMHMRYIAAGPDISFGAGGKGDRELIEVMGRRFGYEAEIIDKVRFDNADISSSRIREAINSGNISLAERMLGKI